MTDIDNLNRWTNGGQVRKVDFTRKAGNRDDCRESSDVVYDMSLWRFSTLLLLGLYNDRLTRRLQR